MPDFGEKSCYCRERKSQNTSKTSTWNFSPSFLKPRTQHCFSNKKSIVSGQEKVENLYSRTVFIYWGEPLGSGQFLIMTLRSAGLYCKQKKRFKTSEPRKLLKRSRRPVLERPIAFPRALGVSKADPSSWGLRHLWSVYCLVVPYLALCKWFKHLFPNKTSHWAQIILCLWASVGLYIDTKRFIVNLLKSPHLGALEWC